MNNQTKKIRDDLTGASATFIPSRGGILSSLIMPGIEGLQERLYQHADRFHLEQWDDLPGAWPFLFPVCARVKRDGETGSYLYNGRRYHMPMHGFAWRLPWSVELENENEIILCLRDNKKTQKMYPFEFELRLHYAFKNGQFCCYVSVANTGSDSMPYSFGFHPYFLVENKNEVELDYHPVRCLQYNKELTDIIGEKKLFSLPTSITHPEINEQLTQLGEEKNVILRFSNGDELHLQAEGVEDPNLFSFLQLYTRADKNFFCIEPWSAHPNAINTMGAMRWLKPGQKESGLLTLSCLAGSR